MIKHFIDFDDYSFQDLQNIIQNAIVLKNEYKQGNINNTLANKTLAMIFDKPSNRTRISFEVGITQLGGHPIFISDKDIQIGKRELIEDVAIVISSMADCILIRTSIHKDIQNFAKQSSVPVINALSDNSHPCQILADIMTYQEQRGSIKGKKVAWIGDGNNVCQTYMQAAKIFDFELAISTPKQHMPHKSFIEKYKNNINYFDKAEKACENADLVVTDVWVSMGINDNDDENNKIATFKNFQVNEKLIAVTKKDSLFMHCLPAHRGEEVSAEVIDGKNSVVWSEAENRMHAQKALLLFLLNA